MQLPLRGKRWVGCQHVTPSICLDRNAFVAGFILKWGLLVMCIFFGDAAARGHTESLRKPDPDKGAETEVRAC